MKFTCYAVGKAVELNPHVVHEMERCGHEIASHNYRWIDYDTLDEQNTREHVKKSIAAIRNASLSKRPPVGFYTGRIGPRTREWVVDECRRLGLDLLYDSDAYNDDLVLVINTALLDNCQWIPASRYTVHPRSKRHEIQRGAGVCWT